MAVIKGVHIVRGLGARGQLGRPTQLGEHWCGWTYIGDDNDMTGIYQRRPRKGGEMTVKMKHYLPMGAPSSAQSGRRSIFRDGMTAWSALTTSQKEIYNRAKYPKGMTGVCRFMREYMKTH